MKRFSRAKMNRSEGFIILLDVTSVSRRKVSFAHEPKMPVVMGKKIKLLLQIAKDINNNIHLDVICKDQVEDN